MQASFVRHLALAPRAVARHTRAGARLGGVRTFASAAGSVASAPSSSSSGSGSWDSSKISWDVRVLYDGDCPLCVREVDFLRGKDGGAGRLDLVDIASDEYDPDANAGIPFETAMSTIHGIKPLRGRHHRHRGLRTGVRRRGPRMGLRVRQGPVPTQRREHGVRLLGGATHAGHGARHVGGSFGDSSETDGSRRGGRSRGVFPRQQRSVRRQIRLRDWDIDSCVCWYNTMCTTAA